MDRLLEIVNEDSSAGEIDKNKFKVFLEKVTSLRSCQDFDAKISQSMQGQTIFIIKTLLRQYGYLF